METVEGDAQTHHIEMNVGVPVDGSRIRRMDDARVNAGIAQRLHGL